MNALEGHALDEDGEHDPDRCYPCLIKEPAVQSECRCGKCCRLLIEAEVEDGEREPKIKEKCSPLYADPRVTISGERELIGWLLYVDLNIKQMNYRAAS